MCQSQMLAFGMANPVQEQMYQKASLAVLRAMETVLQVAVIKQIITLPELASAHS